MGNLFCSGTLRAWTIYEFDDVTGLETSHQVFLLKAGPQPQNWPVPLAFPVEPQGHKRGGGYTKNLLEPPNFNLAFAALVGELLQGAQKAPVTGGFVAAWVV